MVYGLFIAPTKIKIPGKAKVWDFKLSNDFVQRSQPTKSFHLRGGKRRSNIFKEMDESDNGFTRK